MKKNIYLLGSLLFALIFTTGLARADDFQDTADWLKSIGVKDGSNDYTAEKLKTVFSLRLAVKKEVTDAEIEKYVSKLTSLQMLSLDATSVTNAGLVHLNPLKKLTSLDLGSLKGVTGSGMAALKELPLLSELTLQGSGVTAVDLEQVATQLPNLKNLSLGWLSVNSGIAALSKMPKLEKLDFFHTDLDDEGVKQLSALKNLKKLFLWNTNVSDAALSTVKDFPNIEILYLSDTKITDVGMAAVGKLLNLDYLWINGLPITDQGLSQLKNCSKLHTIQARKTQITDAGVAALQTAVPALRVYR